MNWLPYINYKYKGDNYVFTISRDDTIARETDVAKQLMVVNLTISQAFLLIMAGTEKGFLTFGADKMLNMPRLPESMNDSFLYRTSVIDKYKIIQRKQSMKILA